MAGCRPTQRSLALAHSRSWLYKDMLSSTIDNPTIPVKRFLSSSTRYESLYNAVTQQDVHDFQEILESEQGSLFCTHMQLDDQLQHDAVVDDANTDWTGHWKGNSSVVLRPSSAQQVASILRHCHERRIPVVPQAGKTGLVGGSVPTDRGEVVIQLSRLNKIESLDTNSGILKCQAGCILQNLQEYCAHHDHLVPVDLGAKGTCQIGGNIATNAGGVYYYRYGSLAANLVGLQVVLADGRILDLNYVKRTNLKDNTGYKLHQLFLGSEGTLGIVTAVALLCPRFPASRQAALIACPNFISVLEVIRAAKKQLGEVLAALEWMDAGIWKLLEHSGQHRMPPLAEPGDNPHYYILVETHGSNSEHDQEKMEAFLERVLDKGYITNGVLAQDANQVNAFWRIRESANPTVATLGYTYKYDVSLPVDEIEGFIQEMNESRLQAFDHEVVNTNWGHILDGNLHFNVTTLGEFERRQDVLEKLEPFLFEEVIRRRGSISAEHGLGQSKRRLLGMVHDDEILDMMNKIKKLHDENTILNPGKFLPT